HQAEGHDLKDDTRRLPSLETVEERRQLWLVLRRRRYMALRKHCGSRAGCGKRMRKRPYRGEIERPCDAGWRRLRKRENGRDNGQQRATHAEYRIPEEAVTHVGGAGIC